MFLFGCVPTPCSQLNIEPHDSLADAVPPPSKDPKGKHKHKMKSHRKHQSGLGEPSGHQDDNSRDKRFKQ